MNTMNNKTTLSLLLLLVANLTTLGQSQVVKFRLEATDASGTPIESVTVGDEFHLRAYTQHMNGYVSEDNSGVFAGYLDITFDENLVSVAGPIDHSADYQNGKSGDDSVAGLLDDIGGFSSGGDLGIGIEPLGLDEYFLFSVPMRADNIGEVSFLGSESGSYPAHDVLVYGLNEPVPAKDIDFGEVGTRIDFGALNLRAVPEPTGTTTVVVGTLGLLVMRGRRRN